MKKRMLASLLSLCLIVGLLPTAALAAEDPVDGNITASTDATPLAGDGMSGTCGAKDNEDSVTWKLERNNDDPSSPTYTLTISGTGAMADYGREKDQPWYQYADKITEVVIEDGVTTIGAHSLRQLSAINSGLMIPSSVETIGPCALFRAHFNRYTVDENHPKLSVNDGVLFNVDQTKLIAYPIGSEATEYTAPATVTTVGSYAFSGAENLKKIDFSAATSLTQIGQEAFSGAENADAVFVNSDAQSTITVQYQALLGMKSLVMHCNSLKLAPYAVQNTQYIDFSNVTSIDATFDGWWGNNQIFVSNGVNYNVISGADIVYVADDTVAKSLYKLPIRDTSTPAPDIAIVNGGAFIADQIPAAKETYQPTKDDVTFGSWEKTSDYSINTHSGETLKASTYVAKWVTEITFNANGGAGSMAVQQVTEGDKTTTLTSNAFTKTGYTFTGWNTAADGKGTSYGADAVASTVPNGTTLYAQWTANTYTIQFSGGTGAIGSTANVTATYDKPVTLPANGFTMAGKNFAGWAKEATATEAEYSDQTEVLNLAESGTITLHAVWTGKEVRDPDLTDTVVTYNGQPQQFRVESGYTVKYYQNRTEVTNPVNAGVYDVEISRDEDNDYAAYHGRVIGGLIINKAHLTVKAVDKTIRVGESLPTYTYTVSGWQGSDTDDLLSDVAVTCPTADANKADDYPITVSGPAELPNYKISYENGVLTVSPRSSGGDSDSGSSSDHDNERTYAIVTEDDGHGSVSVSADEASAGTRITVTVKPNAGYELDELTVTDSKNKDLKVTKRSETTYTFHMADSKVTVEASFAKDGTVQQPDTRFDDVAKSAWYYNAVEYVAENGIMSGVSAREFAPNAGFSRAMLAQTLYAMSGKPAVKAESTFADVAANAWYADAVNWAAEKGYVSGVGDGKFAPDASVTREQMALILYRYAGSPDASGMAQKEFTDSSSVSAYAVDAIRWAVHEGLISGMENNTLAPQGTATRAQVAQILMNFHQKLDK